MKRECKLIQKAVSRDPTLMDGFHHHEIFCPDCAGFFQDLRRFLKQSPQAQGLDFKTIKKYGKTLRTNPDTAYTLYLQKMNKGKVRYVVGFTFLVFIILLFFSMIPFLGRKDFGTNEAPGVIFPDSEMDGFYASDSSEDGEYRNNTAVFGRDKAKPQNPKEESVLYSGDSTDHIAKLDELEALKGNSGGNVVPALPEIDGENRTSDGMENFGHTSHGTAMVPAPAKASSINQKDRVEMSDDGPQVVSANKPVLDSQSSMDGVNISREYTERLPASDNFQSAFLMDNKETLDLAEKKKSEDYGIPDRYDPSLASGTKAGTTFTFSGKDNPWEHSLKGDGSPGTIEEVEVQTGGFSAEYGRAMGGRVNVVTKTGTNGYTEPMEQRTAGELQLDSDAESYTTRKRQENSPLLQKDRKSRELADGAGRDIATLALQDIRSENNDNFAVFTGPDGTNYHLKVGDHLLNGRVVAIKNNEVFWEQRLYDSFGQEKPPTFRSFKLQSERVQQKYEPRYADYWEFLHNFGFGILDYDPEVWRDVNLDKPVYFKNTYIGGNAKLKYYEVLLSQNEQYLPEQKKLYDHSMLYPQPYDPPAKGAMALYAHLDRSYISEPGRVFLQVGLKGTEQFTWRRPPISIIFLDLLPSELESERETMIDEVLSRLDNYDHVGLINEDNLISPTSVNDFILQSRHSEGSSGDEPYERDELWRLVQEEFSALFSRNVLQNKRLVVLAEDTLDDHDQSAIHELLLQEVNTSVFSWNKDELQSHAAAAQSGDGNLYLIESESDIKVTVIEELASLEKVVARALRLSIQPAPNVRLVQVIGSYPLGQQEKKRVKQAEIAIDEKLANSLGIERDRGEDDPGLQTIIPYFYGNDEHIIIIEFEVQEPGPVAEIKLKYKDMVDLRNSTLQTAVSLSKRPEPPTPRQETIAKNITGITTAIFLRTLNKSHLTRAQKVQLIQRFIDGQKFLPPGFFQDPNITHDHKILHQFKSLLGTVSDDEISFVDQALEYNDIQMNLSQFR